MFQSPLITAVLDWERRLEIEDERRKNHRYEPYMNFLAPLPPFRRERKSIFARIFKPAKDPQPVYHFPSQDCCPET